MSSLPTVLYHGTSAQNLEAILDRGLIPRSMGGESQWEHTVESRADAVYLTSTYPLYFAMNAGGESDSLIIEIDVGSLDQTRLVADEDSLALGDKGTSRSKSSALSRAAHFREHSHKFPASDSLAILGTCAHLGIIPPSAITRIAIIPASSLGRLVLGGFDPIISPTNFMFFGSEYAASVPWIFGDTEVCALNPRLPRPNIEVRSPRAITNAPKTPRP